MIVLFQLIVCQNVLIWSAIILLNFGLSCWPDGLLVYQIGTGLSLVTNRSGII